MQLATACLGNASKVNTLQTNSGIKDAFTQPWIEDLILRSRDLRRLGRTPDEIQAELKKWIDDKREMLLNPFLTLEGQAANLFLFSMLIKVHFRLRRRPGHSSGDFAHHSAQDCEICVVWVALFVEGFR
jgi:hypothetical protein